MEVTLPLIDYNKFADSFKDPQPVVARHATSAWLYLSTRHMPLNQPRTNFVLDVDKNGNSLVFARDTSRISVVNAGFDNWYMPCINPRNNKIRFFSQVDNSWFTTTLPTKVHAEAATLFQNIITSINSVPGCTIEVAIAFEDIAGPGTVFLTDVNNNLWYLDPECSFVKKGQSACQTTNIQTLNISQLFGPCRLTYTDFVDVHSNAITQFQKLKSVTTAGRSGLVLRAYLPPVQVPFGLALFGDVINVTYGNWLYETTLTQNLSFAFRANTVLSSIDIQLFDSNGDILYIPSYMDSNFVFNLTLQIEL